MALRLTASIGFIAALLSGVARAEERAPGRVGVPIEPARALLASETWSDESREPGPFGEVMKRHRAARAAGLVMKECDALADAYRAAAKLGGGIDALFNAAAVLLECGRVAAAEAAFHEIVREHPEYGRASCAVGTLLRARGDLVAARTRYVTCLSLDPTVVEGNVNLAAILVAEYDRTSDAETLKRAVKHIRTALAVDESSAAATTLFASIYYRLGRPAYVTTVLDRVLASHPSYAPALNLRGLLFLREGAVHEAVDAFRAAHESDARYVPALINWATCAGRYGDVETAIEKLAMALAAGGPDKEALSMLAGAYRIKASKLEAAARVELLRLADEADSKAARLP